MGVHGEGVQGVGVYGVGVHGEGVHGAGVHGPGVYGARAVDPKHCISLYVVLGSAGPACAVSLSR